MLSKLIAVFALSVYILGVPFSMFPVININKDN